MDDIAPSSKFEAKVAEHAAALAASSPRGATGPGVALTPLAREASDDIVRYSAHSIDIDRNDRRLLVT